MKRQFSILLCSLFLLSSTAFAGLLKLSPATTMLGGNLLLGANSNNFVEKSSYNLTVEGSFAASFFVVKGLHVGFQAQGKSNLFPKQSITQTSVGLGPRLGYLFDTKSDFYPYLTLASSFLWQIWPQGAFSISLSPHAGLYAAIAENIALDFGLRSSFDFPLTPSGGPAKRPISIELLGGYVGVVGFF